MPPTTTPTDTPVPPTSTPAVPPAPAATGARDISFWQGSTGQAIIAGAASTKNGTCTSVRWLRQYAPFQDPGTKATCSQVATYVLNVINAAGASGASMNALLKGQALATALDSYFSDPALGGNRIGAPAPIGAVTIDLTRICASNATGAG